MHDMLDIIKNVQTIYTTNSSLSTLKDFERVIDELDMYVFKNWIDGELASGPFVEKHWVTCSFMWPKNKMPDPDAAKRLLDKGCKVYYEKTSLIRPIKVRSPDDFRPGTKKGKLEHVPIWVVKIMMPRSLLENMSNGFMNKMREASGIGRSERVGGSAPQAADQAAVQGLGQPGAAPMGGAPGAAPMGGAPIGLGGGL